jgi:hypothetical protein
MSMAGLDFDSVQSKRSAAFLGALLLTACCAHGFQTYMAPDGKPYTWDLSATPRGAVEWKVAPGAPEIVRDAARNAANAWSLATGGALLMIEGENGITVEWDASGARVADRTFLAYTSLGVVQHNVLSASIVINAADYEWHRGSPLGVTTRGSKIGRAHV